MDKHQPMYLSLHRHKYERSWYGYERSWYVLGPFDRIEGCGGFLRLTTPKGITGNILLLRGALFYDDCYWPAWRVLRSLREKVGPFPDQGELLIPKSFKHQRTSPSEALPHLNTVMDAMADGYLRAAAWADAPDAGDADLTDEDREALALIGNTGPGAAGSRAAWTEETWYQVRLLCWRFYEENLEACKTAGSAFRDARSPASESEWSFLGHNLYLTAAGHGAGFRDRDELGEDLAKHLDALAYVEPYTAVAHGQGIHAVEGRLALDVGI